MKLKDKLLVKTKEFSLDIIDFIQSLPDASIYYVFKNQLIRSGTSVGANFRAACRGRSKKEFVAKLGVVIEEADESMFWLELLEAKNLASPDKAKPLWEKANEIVALSISLRSSMKRDL